MQVRDDQQSIERRDIATARSFDEIVELASAHPRFN